jgi:hypothetical protein
MVGFLPSSGNEFERSSPGLDRASLRNQADPGVAANEVRSRDAPY